MLNEPGLRKVDRWDPLSFVLLAHGLGLALSGETTAPLTVALLSGAMALMRLGMAWLTPQPHVATMRFVRAVLSLGLAYAVIVAEGGTESPFFFWILLINGWQVLDLDRRSYQRLGAITLGLYVVTLALTGDFTVASFFRGGLLAAFVLLLALGRWLIDQRRAEVARLDDVVTALVEESSVAMAVFDSDRDTLLYANTAAHEMGIASRDDMARLVLDEAPRGHEVTTLAELVVGARFAPSPLRSYRYIGAPMTEFQIGFHPRRAEGARPVVLVYGLSANNGSDRQI